MGSWNGDGETDHQNIFQSIASKSSSLEWFSLKLPQSGSHKMDVSSQLFLRGDGWL
jgi:hypothetical protein